jgi:toxin-antitoxin system PIN domain toxin
MIVPDINLLVYAHNQRANHHERAREWWETLMNDEHPLGIPWAVTFGFVRLVTHAAVLSNPLIPLNAMKIVASWFNKPNVRPLEPGPRHLIIVEDLFRATQVGGNLTTNTHLAALAIEHQAALHSNDADFSRFPGLQWRNPLA